MIQDIVAACQWDSGKYIIFSDNVFSPLIYYSHLTPIVVSLLFGIYIYLANKKSLLNQIFLFVVVILSLWLVLDLVLWATDSIRIVLFTWSIVNMVEPIIYAGFLYFVLAFVSGGKISLKSKLLLITPLLPVFLLTATHWNILGFNLTNCDREVIEGPMAFYNYIIEIGYVFWIIGLGVRQWFSKNTDDQRVKSSLVIISILVLLLGFSSGNILGSFTEDWALGQYGLFVIPVSIGALSYFVVQIRFLARNQIMAAQVLVIGLWLAVGSILFLQNIVYVRWIVIATLALLAVLGFLLIRSFQLEVEQRKEIEKLAQSLEVANKQQIILIHFVTHQIKGFIAKSRNIFSLMLEGDFGKLPEKMKPMVQEGFYSDTKGVETIQEILSAANIKSGKVTYKKEPFDLRILLEEIVRDLGIQAHAKGLELRISIGKEPFTLSGDRAQLQNAFKNLIDNSIKYTPQGHVDISLAQHDKTIRFQIKDTGVGITPEDMTHLFTEGGRGAESQKINVDSTGFGLYIVKNIIEAHGGKVWAESEGAGKGSTFIVELPTV